MKDYYLAIDLGASGGRHILGSVEDGKLQLNEIYRFINAPVKEGNSFFWNIGLISNEIIAGFRACSQWIKEKQIPGNPVGILRSLGIDTWGVDYVLLDGDGNVIKPVYAYRDPRTEAFLKNSLPFEDRYRITGIADLPFNTIYQLLADKAAGRLQKAKYMLQLPEYFSQLLTGNLLDKQYNEYTMASTTALLDAKKKTWAEGIFYVLELPLKLMKPVREPPYEIGCLSWELQDQTGMNTKVLMIASHDTASAVATVKNDSLYISSGTWSLLGVTGDPVLNDEARKAGYTNEGAHNGRTRFLKNIMGLWVLQSVRHELNNAHSFMELEFMAKDVAKTVPKNWNIDLNLPQFLAPKNMIGEIKKEYLRLGKKAPESPAELAFSVYTSLAQCYKTAIDDLEKITGRKYPAISIIGGGSKDSYLNTLTAEYTGKTVFAGPSEATAVGNILLQMQAAGDPAVEGGFEKLVERSFNIAKF
jgi:rhamnulokinase